MNREVEKKRMNRKIVAFIITGIVCLDIIMSAAAYGTQEEAQRTEAEEMGAYNIKYNRSVGENLNYGSGNIRVWSGKEINITGITQGCHTCKKVYLKLYLEQKYKGSYYTYRSWDLSREDADNITRSMNIIVPKGHYYRVRGYHAVENGTFESISSLTNGVWVGQ